MNGYIYEILIHFRRDESDLLLETELTVDFKYTVFLQNSVQ